MDESEGRSGKRLLGNHHQQSYQRLKSFLLFFWERHQGSNYVFELGNEEEMCV